jgi:hypothetical protein
VVPFLVVAGVAGTTSLLLRGHRTWSTATALVGLAAMVVLGGGIGSGVSIDFGGTRIVGSEWLRLYAVLASVVGLALVLLDWTALHEPDVPGAIVLGLGAAVLALGLVDPGLAVGAATAAGLVGVLVAAPFTAVARSASVGSRELRGLAIAGGLGIAAIAWLGRPLGEIDPGRVVGIAYLAVAMAAAIRLGAIPFHLSAARTADAAPGVALPLLLAWLPGAFAAVALVWVDRSVASLVIPLVTERGLVAAVGAATIILGLVAAWIQDDLEHVVGYTIVAGGGYLVLGLATLDPAVGDPTRRWLLALAVAGSALGAWVVAIHAGFRTRRLPELAGWARRSPVLGASLVLIAVAMIGWPAMSAWQARAAIAAGSLPGPIAALIIVTPLAGLAVFGRILMVGLQPVEGVVRAGRGERPLWPAGVARRQEIANGANALRPRGGAARATSIVLPPRIRQVAAAAHANRSPLASVIVAAVAALAVVVAMGGFGIAGAGASVPAEIGARPSELPIVAGSPPPEASFEPVPSRTSEPGVTFEPVPSVDEAS